MKYLLKFTLLVLILTGCKNESKIDGLWEVTKVEMGENEMTPNARWMRFNSDSTQQSGNGFFQHSYGTWKFDTEKNELSVNNENTLKDRNPPFTVSFEKDKMIWERTEEGAKVSVYLKPISELPKTYGDEVLGVWKLTDSKGEHPNFRVNYTKSDYLFLRWDRKYVIQTDGKKSYGVYSVHGHKPELELIPYGNNIKREFWKIAYKEKAIELTLLNTDSLVQKTFRFSDTY